MRRKFVADWVTGFPSARGEKRKPAPWVAAEDKRAQLEELKARLQCETDPKRCQELWDEVKGLEA
jgi:hypothetical protein